MSDQNFIPLMLKVKYIGRNDSYTAGPYTFDAENGFVCVIDANDWPSMEASKVLQLVVKDGTEPELPPLGYFGT